MTLSPSPADRVADPGIPVIDWFDQLEMRRDPYPAYARMRQAGPVVYVPAISRYLLVTHESVMLAGSNAVEFSSVPAAGRGGVPTPPVRPMLRKDDPAHKAERAVIEPPLRPRAMKEHWLSRFRANVEVWLDHLESVGPDEAELTRDFAAPVSGQNLIDLVGFTGHATPHDMGRWSADFVAGVGNVTGDPAIARRAEVARAQMNDALDTVVRGGSVEADGSVSGHLVRSGMDRPTVQANLYMTIGGGFNEPLHMMTTLFRALDTHPSEREAVLAGEQSWGDAFDEASRWVSPVGMASRSVRVGDDVEWFGHRIPAGAGVGLVLASGNRDETVYESPEQFIVGRPSGVNLAFGRGGHLCAGRWAAKVSVADAALPMLHERFPGIRVDTRRATEWDGWVFRGLRTLPVTW